MSFSVKSFKELNHPVCFKEDAKLVFIKYKEMMALLSTFEDDVFKVCKTRLKTGLLSKTRPLLLILRC